MPGAFESSDSLRPSNREAGNPITEPENKISPVRDIPPPSSVADTDVKNKGKHFAPEFEAAKAAEYAKPDDAGIETRSASHKAASDGPGVLLTHIKQVPFSPVIPPRRSSLGAIHSTSSCTLPTESSPTHAAIHFSLRDPHHLKLARSSSAWSVTIDENEYKGPPSEHLCPTNEAETIHDAVTIFEKLMHEAVAVAQSQHHVDQAGIHVVLNEAALALHSAANIPLAEIETMPGSGSDDSDASHDTSDESSDEFFVFHGKERGSVTSRTTSPTSISSIASTRPDSMPLQHNVDRSNYCSASPRSSRNVICNPVRVKTARSSASNFPSLKKPLQELPLPVSPTSESATQPWVSKAARLYNPESADSVILDFAYAPSKSQPRTDGYESNVSPSRFRRDSGLRSLAAGDPDQNTRVQTSTTRSLSSHMAPGKPVTSAPASATLSSRPNASVPYARRRPRIAPTINPNDEIRGRSRQQSPAFVQSEYYKADEEDVNRPHTLRSGRHPPDAPMHHSLKVHRYKRKGIAREWATLRKRVAAVVACLNTTLIGLMAGIYVCCNFGVTSCQQYTYMF